MGIEKDKLSFEFYIKLHEFRKTAPTNETLPYLLRLTLNYLSIFYPTKKICAYIFLTQTDQSSIKRV